MPMSFDRKLIASAATAAALVLSVHAAGAATLTTLGPNNGSGGVFFNLTADALSNITITGFASYFAGASALPADVAVYTRPFTYVGAEGAAGSWTLLGTVSGTSGATNATLSAPFTLTAPISIAAGTTVGVYLHGITTGNGLRYQGTGATATQTFTDGTLTLTGGAARTGATAFGGTLFSPRVFSGELYYDVTPIPEPGTYGLMALGLLGLGLRHLQRQRRANAQA